MKKSSVNSVSTENILISQYSFEPRQKMALYAKDFQITCNYIEIVKCPVKSVADHRSKNKPPSPLHWPTVGRNSKRNRQKISFKNP